MVDSTSSTSPSCVTMFDWVNVDLFTFDLIVSLLVCWAIDAVDINDSEYDFSYFVTVLPLQKVLWK